MRRQDFAAAYEAASSEALRAFGDGRIYVEKLIENARHIEIQILGDRHGNMLHLGERECSVQRRHQKVIEESPSPLMSRIPGLRDRMGQAAIRAASAAGYFNAGTVEFLADNAGNFYFLEMNTRLQVEHPVTELVTGLDLVRLQVEIAAGSRCRSRRSRFLCAARRLNAEFMPRIRPTIFSLRLGESSIWPSLPDPVFAWIPACIRVGMCRSITIRCWRS